MRRNGDERGHSGLSGVEEIETFRSPEIDRWAKLNNLSVHSIAAHVIGPTGYLFTIETSYPLKKNLNLLPENVNVLSIALEVNLSEVWFDEESSFAVYDCSERSPTTYKMINH